MNNIDTTPSKWYHYLAALGAGFFLANTVPHLTSGITGQEFPPPFAAESGVSLSSPTVNVVWGLVNLLLGYLLLRAGKVKFVHTQIMFAVFVGIAVCALICAIIFGSNPNL
ncbi:MAG: hypothetical protein AAF702_29570 [Chloroflexota bacterium]